MCAGGRPPGKRITSDNRPSLSRVDLPRARSEDGYHAAGAAALHRKPPSRDATRAPHDPSFIRVGGAKNVRLPAKFLEWLCAVGPENDCMHFVRGGHKRVLEHRNPPEMASDLLVCDIPQDADVVRSMRAR